MWLSNGELGEPGGTPLFGGTPCPWSQLPPFSGCLRSFRLLPSAIRLGMSFKSLPCAILVKYALKSISTPPHAGLYRSSRMATAAGLASRFGLSP
jgi:hypothetical protein